MSQFLSKNKSGIYKIINIINNKIYIGSATNIKQRWATHKFRLKNNKHHNSHLQNAWNKYGERNFLFEVLDYVSNKENLIKYEQLWMDLLKPEYNKCKVAGSPLGTKHSEEWKKLKSEKMMGDKNHNFGKTFEVSLETRKKISEKMRGRKLSKETKDKMSKPKSPETIKKMSEGQKKRLSELKKIEELV